MYVVKCYNSHPLMHFCTTTRDTSILIPSPPLVVASSYYNLPHSNCCNQEQIRIKHLMSDQGLPNCKINGPIIPVLRRCVWLPLCALKLALRSSASERNSHVIKHNFFADHKS